MSVFRRGTLLVAVLSLSLTLWGAAPAAAHTGFESSDPPDGASVDAEVSEIAITYSGPAQPSGEGFVVLEPSGAVSIPDSVSSDPENQIWTLSFDPPLAGGMVGVRWTVQAPDAHPISGSFSFTVAAPAAGVDPEPSSQSGDAAPVPPPATTETGKPLGQDAPDSSGVEGSDRLQSAEQASGSATGTQDLDEFLSQTEPMVPNAEGVGAFGRLLGFVGTMLGIGGLAFAAIVVRDHRRDIRSVLKAVRYSAAIVVVGTAIDLAAHLAVANNGWRDILAGDAIESVAVSPFGLAVALRAAAGVLLFAAAKLTHSQIDRVEPMVDRRELVLAGAPGRTAWANNLGFTEPWPPAIGDLEHSLPVDPAQPSESWPPASGDQQGSLVGGTPPPAVDRPITPAIVVSVLVLLASFTFDGHTVTEGNRFITGAVDMVHVVAASIWAGGVVAFSVVLWRRYRRGERLNGLEMALRFSVIAGAALAVAGIAGTILAAIILDGISELWTTPWGRLLVAKTLAVGAAASLGTYNHFVVIPWMNAHPHDDQRSIKLRNTATGEALLLIAVIAITAFLVGASSQP